MYIFKSFNKNTLEGRQKSRIRKNKKKLKHGDREFCK